MKKGLFISYIQDEKTFPIQIIMVKTKLLQSKNTVFDIAN